MRSIVAFIFAVWICIGFKLAGLEILEFMIVGLILLGISAFLNMVEIIIKKKNKIKRCTKKQK